MLNTWKVVLLSHARFLKISLFDFSRKNKDAPAEEFQSASLFRLALLQYHWCCVERRLGGLYWHLPCRPSVNHLRAL